MEGESEIDKILSKRAIIVYRAFDESVNHLCYLYHYDRYYKNKNGLEVVCNRFTIGGNQLSSVFFSGFFADSFSTDRNAQINAIIIIINAINHTV